ncbi:MAG TPA: DUF4010 domain-containing protein [Terriglobia bacterium]|nr:DUF4010 domain-containing protein [Terriglobia bacterium]
MVVRLTQWLPPEAIKIVLVLLLSFLIGLEREERKAEGKHYAFGGVRTFPLIGLIGYSVALLSGGQLLSVMLGFIAVAGFLWLSYWHKLTALEAAGVTSELSALATYLLGALIFYGHLWIATALGVASVLLLELKTALENLSHRLAPEEVLTFAKFLLLTAVILPILPNEDFTRFHINPFKTWLVVVAVSAISYGSYLLQRLTKGQGGIILAALLGGIYSSTVATVALARKASREEHPHLFSGSILIASGVMYLRLVALVGIFNRKLMMTLALPFLLLAALAIVAGWLWSRKGDAASKNLQRDSEPKNPLELGAAFLFAALFVALLVATQIVSMHLGKAGVYSLAALMGVTDVDPFILGLTQTAGVLVVLKVASAAIVIAAASNNVIKGVYAYALADRKTGVQSLCLLAGLAALGLVPLIWLLA